MDFLFQAKEIKEDLIKWRRDFHAHPELGYEELRTSSKIKEFLIEENIEFYETATTGICAIIRGKGEKTIALRGDIDALPLVEKNQCDYTSKNPGKMHACGHDAHTAILMGVAKILNSIKQELKGNVKLFFEPAEETTGGASVMIAEGVLENPKVDAIIGLHVDEKIETGFIGLKKGVVNAASNPFTIKIKGKGGHGARPNDCVDPVVISAQVILALQTIVSREIPPTDPAVITIGSIHGGTAQNIIPEEVVISGVIRTMKTEHREYVKKRLKEVAEGLTTSLRGNCEIEIEDSYPCLYNNDELVQVFKESSSKIIGAGNVIALEKPSMGVESFAYFAMERPSVFYFLGSKNEKQGITHPAHGSHFDIDEECLPIGVALQCEMTIELLKKI
ncbi:MAG: amidohydrolase [Clostridiaceae bacterium]|nr:amidohydrolase [Clostridiaceae bacterium]